MAENEVPDVLRARRFELVDDADRVRAVLGLSRYATVELVGLELFDDVGSARAWLLDERHAGVHIGLAVGGNQVLVASARDPGGDIATGPSLTLCDLDGAPVLSWHVDQDGTVVVRCGHRHAR